MKQGLEKFNKLVEAFESLPTVGKKSATRLAYHLCMNDPFSAMKLSHAIESAVDSVKKCQTCGAMSENELCYICIDEGRNQEKLCIVENAKDILIIEENAPFDGRYFVLRSLDSDAVAPLFDLIKTGITEVVFALTPSIANDAVILFIEDKLKDYTLDFTKIAQGVPTGVSLENVDMLSLTRALEDRVKV